MCFPPASSSRPVKLSPSNPFTAWNQGFLAVPDTVFPISKGQLAHVASKPCSQLRTVVRQQRKKNQEGHPLAAILCTHSSALCSARVHWGLLRMCRQPVCFGVRGVLKLARQLLSRRRVSSRSVVKHFIRPPRRAGRSRRSLSPRLTVRTGIERSDLQAPAELLPHEHTGRPPRRVITEDHWG